jgi:hypothetical protein
LLFNGHWVDGKSLSSVGADLSAYMEA